MPPVIRLELAEAEQFAPRLGNMARETNASGEKMTLRSILLATTACLTLATPALAQDENSTPPPKHHHSESVSARLDRLERVIEEQQAEIRQLKTQLGQGAASGGAASAGAQAAQASAPPAQPQVSAEEFQALQNEVHDQEAQQKKQPVITFNHARPTISSADGRWSFSPRVDVMGDFASYDSQHQTVAGIALKQSGENFRRAQIGFQGVMAGDFTYRFLYDFGGSNGDETYQAALCGTNAAQKLCTTGAGTGPHIKEAWVGYTGILAPFTFQIGALPPPANLGDATAADDLLFNERASPSQLSRGLAGDDGRESVGFIGNGDIWNASAYLTGDTVGKADLIAPGSSQEAFVGRLAVAPVQNPDTNLTIHAGINGTDVIRPAESTSISGTTGLPVTGDFITFSDRPEIRVDNVTFLNTGSIAATSAHALGLEGAASYGPLMVEGENFWYGIDRVADTGKANPVFTGWYVEGSWVLTGEEHKYNMAQAAFTRPEPAEPFDPANNAWGAWELAARYSDTDLNFHDDLKDAVYGGRQDIGSLGLNFYPIYNLKFMFDYQHVDVRSVAKLGNNGEFTVLSMRTQVTF
jgi:phosphate-selective porin OprO and OprP